MALPTTRAEFKEQCLRRLGKPVTKINVADQQVEDCVDEAIQFWQEYHFDAQFKTFMTHTITQEELDTQTIELPELVQHVVKVHNIGYGVSSGMFSLQYQFAMYDLWDLSASTLSQYVIAMQYVSQINNLLTPQSAIRFQRHTNKLVFDANQNTRITAGQKIIIEAYVNIDIDAYPDIWKDRILLDLATSIIKRQWGINMKKYEGIQLPGGITMNGQQMYNEAIAEIDKLKADFIEKYQEPPMWEIA